MDGYERFQKRRERMRPATGGFIFSLLIIGAGLVLLLDNLGILNARDFWQYLPLGLVALGVVKVLNAGNRPAALVFGALLIGGGMLWFLNNLGFVRFDGRLLPPVIIIGVGVLMLARTLDRRSRCGPAGAPRTSGENQVNLWTMFGSVRRVVDTPDFRGADVFSMFGGVDLDLRPARIAATASVEANTIFGGVEIHVPVDWAVELHGMGIFGGYEDTTLHPPDGANAPRLIVSGSAIFGGVTVKNT